MAKIDEIDKKIIDLLMKDGRMSCTEIARQAGNVTERMVRYRIARLLDNKIIKIKAIINPASLGYSVIADVFIEAEPASIREVATRLAEFECISYVACSIGERDISAQIIGRTNAEVYGFVTEVIGKIPGVRKTTTSIVPMTLKDVYDWKFPSGDCRDI